MKTTHINEHSSLWEVVEKDKFFTKIGPLNVHPSIQPGPYPYKALWETPNGQVFGKSVDYHDGGTLKTRWYLPR